MIRVGDDVRVRGFGPNEMIGRVAHKQPGAVWIYFREEGVHWKHRMRDLRPAKPAEVQRALARDLRLRELQAKMKAGVSLDPNYSKTP